METIGITGGIGSGKSVVARLLRCNGYQVYDCDSRARYLMVKDIELKEALILLLGKEIFNSEGNLNKPLLSHLLFSDNDTRLRINALVHEAVRKDIMDKRKKTRDFFFVESAILATGGIVPFCDRIWLVTAPEEVRIQRIKQRDSMTIKEIERRFEVQQQELDLLPIKKTVVFVNDDYHPLLTKIISQLKPINTSYYVERNIGYHREAGTLQDIVSFR